MSKEYDEYKEIVLNNIKDFYPSKTITPMIPNINKELDREIRDRAIIELVKKATLEGKDLTYGDIRLLIDDDSSEKEYENEQINYHTR